MQQVKGVRFKDRAPFDFYEWARVGSSDTNPPRIASRHLFDLSAVTDNLLRADRTKISLCFTLANLTNKVALYNFLLTFSGTHFVAPRTFGVQAGISF